MIPLNPDPGFAEVNASPQDIIQAAEADMNFLAGLCLADIMKFPFPEMFITMWGLLKSKIHLVRDFSKIALGIPRGFAKTTFVKLFIVYVILFTTKRFVAIISYGEEHAISIIKDVCSMLSHPNIKAIFGDWSLNQDIDQASLKVFTFRGRTIILKAVGAKGGIRGINHEHQRPDVIILEDYQKKAESENEEVAKKLYEEMIGTVMKAKSPFGCLYLYVGNMYATPGAILKKLKENDDWLSLIVGGILANGESLWEDLQPLQQLLEEYKSDLKAGVPQVFLAEVLNDENAGIKAGIDITQLPHFPYPGDEIPQGRGIVIDPALDRADSDYNGLGLVGIYDGKACLEKVKLNDDNGKKFTPIELVKAALIMAIQTSTRVITVEDVAYQSSLLYWFQFVVDMNGLGEAGFIFLPLGVGQKSKNGKIKDILIRWSKGEIWVKDEVRPLIINEIIKWQPLKTKNQDTTMDLLWMSQFLLEQHGHLLDMPWEMEMNVLPNAAPRSIAENCSF